MAAERNIARTPMTTATLDAVEAEELAEILEYFLELLDLLVNPDHDAVDFSEGISMVPTISAQISPGSSSVCERTQ